MANIKFTGVHKSFGSNKIIADFNLNGKEDEFLVLVGPVSYTHLRAHET